MTAFKNTYLNKPFSHIYVEENVLENQTAKSILSHFKNSHIIKINHYKDVFNRKNQSFAMQKAVPALIVAEKTNELVYKGAPFCQSFGNPDFYYTSFVLNCLYDCEYCYLRGMYPGGNIVVFVNCEDFFDEVSKISKDKEIFLCISYDTDLLALEPVLGFCKKWHTFAQSHPNVNIELRTKCSNMSFIKSLMPLPNFIIALTLTPQKVVSLYEHKTPSLNQRLAAAKEILSKGFPLRISLDPVLYVTDFEKTYIDFIQAIQANINLSKLQDAAFGSFRISPAYLKAMRKNYPNSLISAYPFQTQNGVCAYPKNIENYMSKFIYEQLLKILPPSKIYPWHIQ